MSKAYIFWIFVEIKLVSRISETYHIETLNECSCMGSVAQTGIWKISKAQDCASVLRSCIILEQKPFLAWSPVWEAVVGSQVSTNNAGSHLATRPRLLGRQSSSSSLQWTPSSWTWLLWTRCRIPSAEFLLWIPQPITKSCETVLNDLLGYRASLLHRKLLALQPLHTCFKCVSLFWGTWHSLLNRMANYCRCH